MGYSLHNVLSGEIAKAREIENSLHQEVIKHLSSIKDAGREFEEKYQGLHHFLDITKTIQQVNTFTKEHSVSIKDVWHLLFQTEARLDAASADISEKIIIAPNTAREIQESLDHGCTLTPELYHHTDLPEHYKKEYWDLYGERPSQGFDRGSFTPKQYLWFLLNKVDVFGLIDYNGRTAIKARPRFDRSSPVNPDDMGTSTIQTTLFYTNMYRECLVRIDYESGMDERLFSHQVMAWNPVSMGYIGEMVVSKSDDWCRFRPVLRQTSDLNPDELQDTIYSDKWKHSAIPLPATRFNPYQFLRLLDLQVDVFGLLEKGMAVKPEYAEDLSK